MYFYIFDSFLGKKKYKKILDKIETRITDLEITGRFIHLTILENIQEIIKEAIKKGAETIVAVGNDKTLCQSAAALVNSSVVLGFIPIGEENNLAEILGIPKEELACEIISARLIEKIDLAKVNHHYFLSSIKIRNHNVLLKSDNCKIFPTSKINEIEILNLNRKSNPRDGLMEVVFYKPFSPFFSFLSKEKNLDSIFFLKKIIIQSSKKEIPVLIDNWKILKTPLEIEIVPQKLKIIVGKERKF